MTELDNAPGNINRPDADALIRQIYTGPVIERDCVFFASFFDAPHIIDWLAERGIEARYEQRAGEGVSIVLPRARAFVGDHIIVSVVDGHTYAFAVERRTGGS